jgi:Skp family chaperone for outer membrane proteins
MAKSKLSGMSITDLRAEISRREKSLTKLLKRQKDLEKELQAVTSEIEAIQGKGAGGAAVSKPGSKATKKKATSSRRRRPRNKQPLADVLGEVMQGKEKLSVGDAMEAVLASGYKSSSDQFRNIVNQTLNKDTRFKKVGRGEYTLK